MALLLAFGACGTAAVAQPADDPASVASTIREDVAGDFDCSLELFDSLRRDRFTDRWVVAYAAAGPDCDEAQSELGRRGAEAGIEFMRRPTLAQLRTLLGPMFRAAELASGCRIAMRGQPVFDGETSRWFVHVAPGRAGCSAAVTDLAAQAADLDVVVLQSGTPTLQRR